MLLEFSGWDYNLALIFGPTAALTKVLPHGWVSPRPDDGIRFLEEKNQSNSCLLIEEIDQGSG